MAASEIIHITLEFPDDSTSAGGEPCTLCVSSKTLACFPFFRPFTESKKPWPTSRRFALPGTNAKAFHRVMRFVTAPLAQHGKMDSPFSSQTSKADIQELAVVCNNFLEYRPAFFCYLFESCRIINYIESVFKSGTTPIPPKPHVYNNIKVLENYNPVKLFYEVAVPFLAELIFHGGGCKYSKMKRSAEKTYWGQIEGYFDDATMCLISHEYIEVNFKKDLVTVAPAILCHLSMEMIILMHIMLRRFNERVMSGYVSMEAHRHLETKWDVSLNTNVVPRSTSDFCKRFIELLA